MKSDSLKTARALREYFVRDGTFANLFAASEVRDMLDDVIPLLEEREHNQFTFSQVRIGEEKSYSGGSAAGPAPMPPLEPEPSKLPDMWLFETQAIIAAILAAPLIHKPENDPRLVMHNSLIDAAKLLAMAEKHEPK